MIGSQLGIVMVTSLIRIGGLFVTICFPISIGNLIVTIILYCMKF